MGPRCRRKQRASSQEIKQANFKFKKGDRVLCYEPDLKKARVLYDSKVLDVVEKKHNGKSKVEYKIHFSGWNSSWDRFVDEDFVLQDTDENRALQEKLKEQADVLLKIHDKKKKKRKKTIAELLKEATQDKNPVPSTSKGKTDKESDSSSESSDESESSEDEDAPVPRIILSNNLRYVLEWDKANMTRGNMLVRLPARISVICVFEAYVKHYAFAQLESLLKQRLSYLYQDKKYPLSETLAEALAVPTSKHGFSKTPLNLSIGPWLEEVERLFRKVQQAQQVIYGLKTIFDHALYLELLYSVENEQYKSTKKMRPIVPTVKSDYIIPRLPPLVPLQPRKLDQDVANTSEEQKKGETKRTDSYAPTRSQSKTAKETQQESERLDYDNWQKKVQHFVSKIDAWKMMPLKSFQEREVDPSMLYGVIHLLRFLVRLPDILNKMVLPRKTSRIIARHVNQIFQYMEACHNFSTKELYIKRAGIYEEDRFELTGAPSGTKEKNLKLPVELSDQDKANFSTRSHRTSCNVKLKPNPAAKIIEITLSDDEGQSGEHEISASVLFADLKNALDAATVACNKVKSLAADKNTNKEKAKEEKVIKKSSDLQKSHLSGIAQPKEIQSTDSPKKKSDIKKDTTSKAPAMSTPVPPIQRHVRESAANAAAHIIASQQYFSRSSPSTTKRDPKGQESAGSRKRRRSENSPLPVPKKKSRTSVTPTAKANSNEKLVSNSSVGCNPEKSLKEKPKEHGSPRVSPDRLLTSSVANKSKLDNESVVPRILNRSRCASVEKDKTSAKRISSPRTSTSGSIHKEPAPIGRTPQKSPPRSPTSIRLRSKSGERQLRSKGSLINALSLGSPQRRRLSSKTYEKSPVRRESLSGSNKESQTESNETPGKDGEQSRSLRSRR